MINIDQSHFCDVIALKYGGKCLRLYKTLFQKKLVMLKENKNTAV